MNIKLLPDAVRDWIRAQRGPTNGTSSSDAQVQQLTDEVAALRHVIDQVSQQSGPGHSDRWYNDFEVRFRGSREVVHDLERGHVETLGSFGATDLSVLDIGCGRGELLELLAQAGISATGIDLNAVALEEARKVGVSVTQGDAVAHLDSLPESSLRAVCGIHIVEHLTSGERARLFASAFRAIAPGGGVVFETPNPENLQVGAMSFWLDPTHLRPLPSPLLAFEVEQAGFSGVEVHTLHPSPLRLTGERHDDPAVAKLWDAHNGTIGADLDYYVIGRVPDIE